MTTKQMLEIIYDTLMANDDMPQFDISKIDDQELDNDKGEIIFNYGDKSYAITVREIPSL